MGFLRRLLGGRSAEPVAEPDAADEAAGSMSSSDLDPDALERQHELEVLREDQARLDELQQRQLRYAQYSWQPPDQGG
ncbi:MAG TPA: hypothetical protein VFO78_02270, partial [Candidatus Limnocylindrales bacterium]|nr:hypothetical protein [Candidatus Limnocylindrales bacterium]